MLALGVSLALLVWFAYHDGRDGRMRGFAVLAGVLYLSQAGVGALFVLSAAAPLWGAAHVGLAAATWGALVILSLMEWMNSRDLPGENTWKPQSEAR